ncbi:nitric oxide reductase transcriptional regulator NorR [Halomonas sp. WWR20]
MTAFLIALKHLLQQLSEGQNWRQTQPYWADLLRALVRDYPADASTLLVMVEGELRPVAVFGLDREVLGRHFALDAHPRLATIAAHPGVCRFPQDSQLPDPFDGLLDETLSEVHDCIGVALRDGSRLIGMLTLDALTPGSLTALDEGELIASAALLATCLRLAEQLDTARLRLSEVLDDASHADISLQWHSPAMRELDASIDLVAATNMGVLVYGETGVGKERIARALHARSTRRRGPMVRVNCGAISESLIESELFGHRRGAFSGAVRDHRGHFAMADGGTLMLDEVGELPLALQPKLLRALQEGEIQPLGSERPQQVDVRIIALTNRNLAEEVAAGRFREDLYHRLNAFPLRVPPLRERYIDLPVLAGHFLEDNRIRLGLANLRLAPEAQARLLEWRWPGNVRELEHTLARAALRAVAEQTRAGDIRRQTVVRIEAHHLDLAQTPHAPAFVTPAAPSIVPAPDTDATSIPALREATDAFQRQLIAQSLEQCNGNWAGVARQLQLDRSNLHRLAKRLGLKPA